MDILSWLDTQFGVKEIFDFKEEINTKSHRVRDSDLSAFCLLECFDFYLKAFNRQYLMCEMFILLAKPSKVVTGHSTWNLQNLQLVWFYTTCSLNARHHRTTRTSPCPQNHISIQIFTQNVVKNGILWFWKQIQIMNIIGNPIHLYE